jgi:isopenicillin N synthase-like dioxygenase
MEIGTIDVQKLAAGDTEEVKRLMDCATTRGFLYLSNHGVANEVMEGTVARAYAFFDMPDTAKQCMHMSTITSSRYRGYTRFGEEVTKGKRDLKETIDVGIDGKAQQPREGHDEEFLAMIAPNPWAEAKERMSDEDNKATVEALAQSLDTYVHQVSSVGDVVMTAIAKGLDLSSPDFFEPYFDLDRHDAFRIARCCYYPAREVSTEKEYGIGPHTDVGTLVLLYSDNRGLQAQDTESSDWIDVTPSKNESGESKLILNFGDVMEKWTSGRIKATPHRVINQTPNETRLSLPVFYEPNLHAEITPLHDTPDNHKDQQTSALHYGKHVYGFFQRSFPEL